MTSVLADRETTRPSQGPIRAGLSAERSTALAAPAAKALLMGSVIMAVVSATANLSGVEDLTTDESLQLAMHASTVPAMIFSAIAGAYSATTDHRFGLVDQRLLSDPIRRRVLGVKMLAAAVLGMIYGLLGVVTALATVRGYFGFKDVSLDLGSPIILDALLGVLLATPLFAVIGVAVGNVVRHQPPAMSGLLVWLLIIEPALIVGWPEVGRWLPGAAGVALTGSPDPGLLGQGSGAVVLVAYAMLSLAIAVVRFDRVDL